jgi:hypothetical protein
MGEGGSDGRDAREAAVSGPLGGQRVAELQGRGPGPSGAMIAAGLHTVTALPGWGFSQHEACALAASRAVVQAGGG